MDDDAFQAGAFQRNAFQIGFVIAWARSLKAAGRWLLLKSPRAFLRAAAHRWYLKRGQ
ncbi:MAG: hypothetical protein IPG16_02100 [Comamonadaceae bacterium]|jgi:hypothetical protein|nr:hypothetical protein [Comamonadaceae bacterium]